VTHEQRFRDFPVKDLHIIQGNPFWPVYQRYYHFVGVVLDQVGDLAHVLVYGYYGPEDQGRFKGWALRRKQTA